MRPRGSWAVFLGLAALALRAHAAPSPATVSIAAPAPGAALSGKVTVVVQASSGLRIRGVQIKLDGVVLGEAAGEPPSLLVNTLLQENGPHTISAVLWDAGGSHPSASVSVTIDNLAPVAGAAAASSVTTEGAVVSWTTSKPADSQVEYGLTTAYDQGTSPDPAQVTAHSVVLSGLAAAATYHYRVKSRDPLGRLIASPDYAFTTPPEPPIVAIAMPSAGAAVSGTTTLLANAYSRGAIAAVQFALDGAPLGPSLTAWPYVFDWNTAGVAGGTHTLTAMAVDSSANVSTSAPVAIFVATTVVPGRIGIAAASAQGAPEPDARAPQKFLSPALADGVNDEAVFGPDAREVAIFDLRGREVFHARGGGSPIVWDCKGPDGRIVASGAYVARISTSLSKPIYQTFAVVK